MHTYTSIYTTFRYVWLDIDPFPLRIDRAEKYRSDFAASELVTAQVVCGYDLEVGTKVTRIFGLFSSELRGFADRSSEC